MTLSDKLVENTLAKALRGARAPLYVAGRIGHEKTYLAAASDMADALQRRGLAAAVWPRDATGQAALVKLLDDADVVVVTDRTRGNVEDVCTAFASTRARLTRVHVWSPENSSPADTIRQMAVQDLNHVLAMEEELPSGPSAPGGGLLCTVAIAVDSEGRAWRAAARLPVLLAGDGLVRVLGDHPGRITLFATVGGGLLTPRDVPTLAVDSGLNVGLVAANLRYMEADNEEPMFWSLEERDSWKGLPSPTWELFAATCRGEAVIVRRRDVTGESTCPQLWAYGRRMLSEFAKATGTVIIVLDSMPASTGFGAARWSPKAPASEAYVDLAFALNSTATGVKLTHHGGRLGLSLPSLNLYFDAKGALQLVGNRGTDSEAQLLEESKNAFLVLKAMAAADREDLLVPRSLGRYGGAFEFLGSMAELPLSLAEASGEVHFRRAMRFLQRHMLITLTEPKGPGKRQFWTVTSRGLSDLDTVEANPSFLHRFTFETF